MLDWVPKYARTGVDLENPRPNFEMRDNGNDDQFNEGKRSVEVERVSLDGCLLNFARKSEGDRR